MRAMGLWAYCTAYNSIINTSFILPKMNCKKTKNCKNCKYKISAGCYKEALLSGYFNVLINLH